MRGQTDVVAVYHMTKGSKWTWVVEEIWTFGNRLRSTHSREFLYMKLFRPAYFARITQLLPHPGHEQWQVLHTLSFNVMTPPPTVFSYVGWHAVFPRCQVLIQDGKTDIFAHVRSNLCCFICLRAIFSVLPLAVLEFVQIESSYRSDCHTECCIT